MSTAAPCADHPSNRLRLRVHAECDPSTLPRVLANFQNLNILPRRIVAELSAPDELYVEIDVIDLSEHRLRVIAEKIAQIPPCSARPGIATMGNRSMNNRWVSTLGFR